MSGQPLLDLVESHRKETEKRPSLSFAAFISESALMELERRNILKEAQFISLIGFQDDNVILKDFRKGGRIVEVQMRNRRLRCLYHSGFDCIHVGFALALPEVRKALVR